MALLPGGPYIAADRIDDVWDFLWQRFCASTGRPVERDQVTVSEFVSFARRWLTEHPPVRVLYGGGNDFACELADGSRFRLYGNEPPVVTSRSVPITGGDTAGSLFRS